MQRLKSASAVLAVLLGIVVSAVGRGAQQYPVVPPSASPLTAAPACTLTAEPLTVERGQSVTLRWISQNAQDIDLEPGVGKVGAGG
jgi:hypothetical protein